MRAREAKMQRIKSLVLLMIFVGFSCFIHVNGLSNPSFDHHFSSGSYYEQMKKMQALKSSLIRRELASSPAPSPAPSPTIFAPPPSPEGNYPSRSRVIQVTTFGADPTGKNDSTEALLRAIGSAFEGSGREGSLMEGINNLGGTHISLEGGIFLISRPLRMPLLRAGNLMISGGTLQASDNFPTDGYLIELSASSTSYNYEFFTLKDLMIDCNFRGGGISVINSLRTNIDNCYISHFNTDGILVQRGHETYIRNTFIGQHITAGGDPGERNFSGTGVNLMGNDNALTDVVIFSASIGVMISGQGNTLSGVHCYNKATGFGGTGIYLKLPNLTQTRIVNCYLDYNGIIAEDPNQLTITNSFFLGDGFILLKSINGIAKGINIVDNMFSGSNKGIDIVQLDESSGRFNDIDQIVVDRNIVRGMELKATIARQSVQGNGISWTFDFNPILLFPNLINHVQYTLLNENTSYFSNHALRSVDKNRVMIQSDSPVLARVFVTVNQGSTN
ncbi:polygalacturonase QRT3 [Mercurialis annua]|uniref:polygalacturonase QRT3 n=1 Tax=Mercurialis annua TaxID=3986 RepID=UPI00215ED138|nr:polygalacturonase QRT3 [Mercurialis annua]